AVGQRDRKNTPPEPEKKRFRITAVAAGTSALRGPAGGEDWRVLLDRLPKPAILFDSHPSTEAVSHGVPRPEHWVNDAFDRSFARRAASYDTAVCSRSL